MIRADFTKRTAFRLASLSAAITTLLMLAIFSGLFFKFRHDLREALKTHVEEVSGTFEDVYRAQGRNALVDIVSRRSFVGQGEEDMFLLTDQSGARLAGNLRSLPRFDGWRFVRWDQLDLIDQWPGKRPTNAILGKWTTLGDTFLFVGVGNRQIRTSQQLLFEALCLGIFGSLVSAAIGGAWFGLRTQRRMAHIERVLADVAAGKLRERIPLENKNDDIEKVSSLVNDMLDRFETLVGRLRDITTDIAHDLRSPITRLRNKFEIMRDDPSMAPTVDDALEEVDSISSTFDSLLQIAEIESGERRRYFGKVDLASVVLTVTDALEAVAEERGHKLEVSVGSERIPVFGDKQLLCRLLMNLVENSIQHCPRPAHIKVCVNEAGDHAVLRVEDDGPGIPQAERDKVFRRLYRLDRSRSTPGSGLGLSLVAAIAELHGAKASICDSERGLCISVQIKLADESVRRGQLVSGLS
jgi:signal transduction histidine kinase